LRRATAATRTNAPTSPRKSPRRRGARFRSASLWLLRWARDPRRPRLAAFVERSVIGGSLRRAQDALDEVARFAA
jgi:hypothetical protein